MLGCWHNFMNARRERSQKTHFSKNQQRKGAKNDDPRGTNWGTDENGARAPEISAFAEKRKLTRRGDAIERRRRAVLLLSFRFFTVGFELCGKGGRHHEKRRREMRSGVFLPSLHVKGEKKN